MNGHFETKQEEFILALVSRSIGQLGGVPIMRNYALLPVKNNRFIYIIYVIIQFSCSDITVLDMSPDFHIFPYEILE